jgi:hypothetical protein
MSGGMVNTKGVDQFTDAHHRKYESFMVDDEGNETLGMTIEYTRKK